MRRNKLMGRRQFAKLTGGAALVAPLVPLASRLGWAQEAPKKPAGEMPAPAQLDPRERAQQPEPKLKLSKEQEERVKQAVERRDRQLAGLRRRTLRYDAEPAFVFQVRERSNGGKM